MKATHEHSPAPRVLHVIVPQREGAIGGADLHVLDLAVAQQRGGTCKPLILTPRAPSAYLQRLHDAGLESLAPALFRADRYRGLPRRRGIALVHAHGYEANYLVAAMRMVSDYWRRLPLVVTAHGWIETTLRLRLHSHIDRYCGRSADVRIASAGRHARALDSNRGIVTVVHNGIPDPAGSRLNALRADRSAVRRSLGLPMQATILGSLGRLSPEKRIDLLLTATRQLASDGVDVHVLIVGGGKQRTELEARAGRLGLARRVIFTGLVRDITPTLVAMDVLVQPSDIEGTPRSVVEAMAHGVPVVGTDVGDMAELLDGARCGVLVPPGNDRLLSQGVSQLLADPVRARELARRARSRYEQRYTIEIMCRQVGEGYHAAREICAGHRR